MRHSTTTCACSAPRARSYFLQKTPPRRTRLPPPPPSPPPPLAPPLLPCALTAGLASNVTRLTPNLHASTAFAIDYPWWDAREGRSLMGASLGKNLLGVVSLVSAVALAHVAAMPSTLSAPLPSSLWSLDDAESSTLPKADRDSVSDITAKIRDARLAMA